MFLCRAAEEEVRTSKHGPPLANVLRAFSRRGGISSTTAVRHAAASVLPRRGSSRTTSAAAPLTGEHPPAPVSVVHVPVKEGAAHAGDSDPSIPSITASDRDAYGR